MAFEQVTLLRRSFLAIVLLLIYVPAWGATYYVDATGGNDSNSGIATTAPWKTILKVNNSSFSAGDLILFKRGETWREQLTVRWSGSAGTVITFGAYGATGAAPIINGSNLITPWTQSTGNVYQASLTTEPKQVFKDGVRLTLHDGATTGVGLNEWDWAANVLYVNVGGNPSGYTIEASQRNYGILIDSVNYITIDGLNIQKAQLDGIGNFTSTGNAITNSTIQYNYRYGINEWRATGTDTLTISYNTIHHNGGSGMEPNNLSSSTISHNTIYNNDILDEVQLYHAWGAGIKLVGKCTNNTVEYNTIYLNGTGTNSSIDLQDRAGIWLDTVGPGNIVRYNLVYSNLKYGIFIEDTDSSQVYYNVVYGHTENSGARGITVGRSSNNNIVYNNTSYGNGVGLSCEGTYPTTSNDITGNIFKNNISVGNTRYQLMVYRGGENDGIYGSGNIYTYNNLGVESAGFIQWGFGVTKNTYSAWETAYGGTTHSVQSDPLFVSKLTPDFHLQASSPAINAGTNVGLTTDYAGNPIGGLPDIGAYEYTSLPPALPPAPSNLSATPASPSQITMNWTDQSTNETGFLIERKTGAGGTYSQISTASANATTYGDSGLAEGTTYFYRVRAFSGAGNSAYSNEASATTPVSLPSKIPTFPSGIRISP